MSRNASSRLNADQDWALLGPDGQTLQPSLNGVPPQQQQRVSLGQVLHQAPGVASRRASRTLSGACGVACVPAVIAVVLSTCHQPNSLACNHVYATPQ
jgi:hypothetical protein